MCSLLELHSCKHISSAMVEGNFSKHSLPVLPNDDLCRSVTTQQTLHPHINSAETFCVAIALGNLRSRETA